MADKDKILDTLERLEVDAYDDEKDARIEITQCKPSKLFNLISRSSFYRTMAGVAEEEFPEDLDIKEHVKSSKDLFINKTLGLTSKFEKECLCLSKERIGTELKEVLAKYKYV